MNLRKFYTGKRNKPLDLQPNKTHGTCQQLNKHEDLKAEKQQQKQRLYELCTENVACGHRSVTGERSVAGRAGQRLEIRHGILADSAGAGGTPRGGAGTRAGSRRQSPGLKREGAPELRGGKMTSLPQTWNS
ncbi:hypothetical protein ABFV05_020691 [Capra hircus]